MSQTLLKNHKSFLKLDLSSYTGKWVAISDDEVIAVGDSLAEVMKEAKSKIPGKKPLYAKVPGNETMIF